MSGHTLEGSFGGVDTPFGVLQGSYALVQASNGTKAASFPYVQPCEVSNCPVGGPSQANTP